MRSDRLYLQDIVEAADAIAGFIGGSDRDSFSRSDLLISAVQMKLTIIGEAASRIKDQLRDKHPEIAWKKVAAYRNFAVHAYFAVSPNVVWDTATIHAPAIKTNALAILANEFPA